MAFLLPVLVEGIGRAATGISRKAAPGGGGGSVSAPSAVLAVLAHPLLSPLHWG